MCIMKGIYAEENSEIIKRNERMNPGDKRNINDLQKELGFCLILFWSHT